MDKNLKLSKYQLDQIKDHFAVIIGKEYLNYNDEDF